MIATQRQRLRIKRWIRHVDALVVDVQSESPVPWPLATALAKARGICTDYLNQKAVRK